MKKSVNNKAQQSIGLSFGMIFSIILIIFFLIIAFIAIRAFIGTRDCTQLGIFIDDFDTEVTNTWNSQEESATFKRAMPSKLDFVCFSNLTEEPRGEWEYVYEEISIYRGNNANMFFYPKNNACQTPYKIIKHLDLPKIISSDNPHCFPIKDGVVRINIEKEFNDRLVRVS